MRLAVRTGFWVLCGAVAVAAPARAFEERAADGRAAETRVVEERVADNRLADSRGAESRVADSRVARPVYRDAQQALEAGIATYSAGNAKSSVEALTYAAQGGAALAQWKLGKMYAAGDGVAADDYKAYQYFAQIVDHYDEDTTPRRELPVVASAFVAVGAYALNGIPGSKLRADPRRAFNMFQYAATNFGDANAQYNLARMYLDGAGVDKDARQAARWLRLAAEKGHAPSQALLGELLFTGPEGVARQRAQGLMYLTLARESASDPVGDRWIVDLYDKAMKEAADNDKQAALAYLEGYLKRR
ncbi:MAG: sel1 repeat family protein [Hyphomicrobiales bacterium]|nr:sel1 repeat family protein [Hyphomicrobiales bacterium]